MRQLRGDPAKWGTDQQIARVTENADRTNDEEQEEPDVNTMQDRINQQQIADQQMEEEEMQLQEMMGHELRDTKNTNDPQTQEGQQNEEEILLREMINNERGGATRPPRNQQTQQTATQKGQGVHEVLLSQLKQLEQNETNKPGTTDEGTSTANNKEADTTREFMTEVNRLAEAAETEKEKKRASRTKRRHI
ncbi:hypothetical protein CYMTET_4942 [Cymbomonas tetramitiformis]|uniref:Uncharacterized protein n=1 Tax=Cymbomonas tetramitiformis TaxID=36881 RepID=A0AAE0LJE4_9CHLO|nr:hypothetical protein CYMTET_4942 [Cymbomonas tetramitiformis]